MAAVTRWYYREAGRAAREAFRPVIEVIERAAPGGVELTRAEASPGFALRPGARVFPKEFEPDLRTAVETAMLRSGEPGGPQGDGRLLTRIVRALRRLFR
ncbi:MAG TPA: hypothetical protein VNI61_04145 [Gemmatimonadales bacterium]|nr:hypothetical protein [Gemmatimonadales bacterium]